MEMTTSLASDPAIHLPLLAVRATIEVFSVMASFFAGSQKTRELALRSLLSTLLTVSNNTARYVRLPLSRTLL